MPESKDKQQRPADQTVNRLIVGKRMDFDCNDGRPKAPAGTNGPTKWQRPKSNSTPANRKKGASDGWSRIVQIACCYRTPPGC